MERRHHSTSGVPYPSVNPNIELPFLILPPLSTHSVAHDQPKLSLYSNMCQHALYFLNVVLNPLRNGNTIMLTKGHGIPIDLPKHLFRLLQMGQRNLLEVEHTHSVHSPHAASAV